MAVASDIYGRPEAKRRECSRGRDERGFAEKDERRVLSNFGNYPALGYSQLSATLARGAHETSPSAFKFMCLVIIFKISIAHTKQQKL
jgi:hypothetical protein